MSDAFMTALFGAREVKASAKVKLPDGQTRTITFRDTVPTDASDDAFVAAARDGVDLSVKVKGADGRSKSMSGKGVFGAAAVSATSAVLGYAPPADTVPEPVRRRGRSVVPAPSENSAPPANGAVTS